MSNEEIIEKWRTKPHAGQGYVILDRQNPELIKDLITTFISKNIGKVVHIGLHSNVDFELTNQVQSIKVSNIKEFGIGNQINCSLLILDTNGFTVSNYKTVTRRVKFKFVLALTYNDSDIRYLLKVRAINSTPYKLVNSKLSVELNETIKAQYVKYDNFIKEKIGTFDIPNEELAELDGITNSFELIQACVAGRGNTSANYYRTYVAELLGWESDMDLSIDYMKELDDNYSPFAIGEVAKLISGTIRSRNDIIKNSSDKKQAILETIDNNLGKSIVVLASSVQMAEDIEYELSDKGIDCGIYNNYIKSKTLADPDTGLAIKYKTGNKAGMPKLFGKDSIKKMSIDSYNQLDHNILVTYGKLDAKFKPNRVDVIIIANLHIEYENVFYNNNFIFPTNKTIEVIYVYVNEQKEVYKLNNFMYRNDIRQNKKRGIYREI